MTGSNPLLISVLDVIQHIKACSTLVAHNTWGRLKVAYPEVIGKVIYTRPTGRGKETPMAEINNILYIILRVPGDAAQHFAEGSASIVTRYLGGSESMQAEIAANRDRQEILARTDPTNPMRAFGKHVEETEGVGRALADGDSWRDQRVEGLVAHHALGDLMKDKGFPMTSHWQLMTRQNQTVLDFTETTSAFKNKHGVPQKETLPDHMSRSQLAARQFMSELVMSSAKNANPNTAADFQRIVDTVGDLVAVTLKGSHFYESNPFVTGNKRVQYGVSAAQTAKAAAEIKASEAAKLIADSSSPPVRLLKRRANTMDRYCKRPAILGM